MVETLDMFEGGPERFLVLVAILGTEEIIVICGILEHHICFYQCIMQLKKPAGLGPTKNKISAH